MAYSRSIKHASKIGRYAWNMAMASRRALIASALRCGLGNGPRTSGPS